MSVVHLGQCDHRNHTDVHQTSPSQTSQKWSWYSYQVAGVVHLQCESSMTLIQISLDKVKANERQSG